MKRYIIAFLLACPLLHAQEVKSVKFTSPFDFPLYLSANFGELRTNHFHGGLDFKTQGTVNKPVRSIADGYVSRITVSAGGYGNALYVTHPNGYLSVYGHLNSFSPAIARYVEQYQYEKETFTVDIPVDSIRFPVKQGEVIALSGNTGFSFGPHLHMEIRDAATNEPIDPLPYYKSQIRDTRAPVARSITFYPISGSGIVNGSIEPKTCNIVVKTKDVCLEKQVNAWGKIGIGITANDYMDGTSNTYGVRSVTLLVDSTKIFQSLLSRYSFGESRAINSWTDYAAYKEQGRWVMKSFVAPGNPLRFLLAGEERGVIAIDKEQDYHFTYLLEDLYGNISRYAFVVHGCPQPIPAYHSGDRRYLHYDRSNMIQEPGCQLVIPRGMLYEDVALNTSVRADSSAISFEYSLHDKPLPLHAGCELMIGIRHLPVADTLKYYIQRCIGTKRYSAGGRYENGWMKTNIYELGTYRVAVDTVPPRLTSLKALSARSLVFKVTDEGTGIKSYRGTVDGKFILVAYNAKNGTLTCRLDPKRVSSGKHTFHLVVEDYCGNITTIEKILTC